MPTYKHKSIHTIDIGKWSFRNHIASVPEGEAAEFEKLCADLKQSRHIVELNEEALRNVERTLSSPKVIRGATESTQSTAKLLRASEVDAEKKQASGTDSTTPKDDDSAVNQPETGAVDSSAGKVETGAADLNDLKKK